MSALPKPSPRREWENRSPNSLVDAQTNESLNFKGLTPGQIAKARSYLQIADSLRRDRPFFTDNTECIARKMGLACGTGDEIRAAVKTVQRLESDMERWVLIRRVLIHGRVDRVTGRATITGRVGIIPRASLTQVPFAETDEQVANVEQSMRERSRSVPQTLAFPPIVARQIRRGCTTDLSSSPPSGEILKKTTTTEPRESLSFSSRPDPEPQNTPTPETSPDIPPPPAPGAAPEVDPAALNQLADRIAALKLVTTPAKVLRFQIRESSLRNGRPLDVLLGWLALLVDQAEGKENGNDPVRGWAWFAGVLEKWHEQDGPSLPGARKPPAVPAAPAAFHRRQEAAGPQPPDRMTDQERAEERVVAEEMAGCFESLAKTALASEARARFEKDARNARARIDELDRGMAKPGVIPIYKHIYMTI